MKLTCKKAVLIMAIVIDCVSLGFFIKTRFDTALKTSTSDTSLISLDGDDTPSPYGKYFVGNYKVYYERVTSPGSPTLLPNADSNTFKMLRDDYARDATHVFFGGVEIDGAHPESFVILLSRPAFGFEAAPSFAKDATSVFVNSSKLNNADPNSFIFLKENYEQDKNFVYYKGVRMDGVSPQSFRIWDGTPYAKDATHVFVSAKSITSADASTFEALTNYKSYSLWAKDSQTVYWYGMPIPGADSTTFELYWTQGLYYGKDATHVYNRGKAVEGADPKTFQSPDRKF